MLHHRTFFHIATFFSIAFFSQCNALNLVVPNGQVVPGQPTTVQWNDGASAPDFFQVHLNTPTDNLFVANVARESKALGSFTWDVPPDLAIGGYTLQAIQTVPPFDAVTYSPVMVVSQDVNNPAGSNNPPPPPSTPPLSSTPPVPTIASTPELFGTAAGVSASRSASLSSETKSTFVNKATEPTPSDTVLKPVGMAAQSSGNPVSHNTITRATLIDGSDGKQPTLSSDPSAPSSDGSGEDGAGPTLGGAASSNKKLNSAAIAGAVIGVLVGIFVLVGLIVFLRRKNRKVRPYSFHRNMMVRDRDDTYASAVIAGMGYRGRGAVSAVDASHGTTDGYADDWLRNSRRINSDTSNYTQHSYPDNAPVDYSRAMTASPGSASFTGHDAYMDNHLETEMPMQIGGGLY